MNRTFDDLLAPYFDRIGERRGLRRWMNQALRTRPELPDLLHVITRSLLNTEALFEYTGAVRMSRNKLYNFLADAEPDWVIRRPHPFPGLVVIRSGEWHSPPMIIDNRLALDQATALGKMVRLLQEGPKGIWGLDSQLLRMVRKNVNAHGQARARA